MNSLILKCWHYSSKLIIKTSLTTKDSGPYNGFKFHQHDREQCKKRETGLLCWGRSFMSKVAAPSASKENGIARGKLPSGCVVFSRLFWSLGSFAPPAQISWSVTRYRWNLGNPIGDPLPKNVGFLLVTGYLVIWIWVRCF